MKHFLIWIALPILSVLSCSGDTNTTGDEANNNIDTSATDTVVIMSFTEFAGTCEALEANINSLDSITNWFNANKVQFSQEEKDSACMIYIQHMWKLEQSVDGEYDQEDEMQEQYGPYGFTIGGGEGMLWLIVNTAAVGEKFNDDISQDLREYLRLGEITGKQYTADAGMLISYEEWGDVLIDLEDRIRQNRKSKYYDQFIQTYQDFLRWYMWGMDNTPIQDWGSEPGLNDDVKVAYEKIIADESHRTGEIIRVHWLNMETGDGYNVPWDEQWRPSKAEIEHYFYDELEETE